MRNACFGGSYDCEDNLYYWVLLEIVESKRMNRDMDALVIGLMGEGQGILEILSLLCS